MSTKVLVVDDNDINRTLIKETLTYSGFEVIEAVDGQEAIDMVKAQRPACLLMDIQMPVMDGYTAIRMLRSDPDTKAIKIIAVTSFAMVGDRERALEAGADEYVSKPIDVKTLPLLVKDIIG